MSENLSESFESVCFKRVIQNKTVALRCDSRLKEQAEWLLKTIEAVLTENNETLHNGWTLEIGFSVLALIESDGAYTVCEPDFEDNPFETVVEDVSRSLWTLVMQSEVSGLAGVAELQNSPRFDDTIVLRKGCLQEYAIFLQRDEPSNEDAASQNGMDIGDSGWYIGGLDDDEEGSDNDDDYEAIYAYQLFDSRPMLVSALALPVGYVAVFEGEEITAIYDEDENLVWCMDDEDDEEYREK
jgi:hypothetical protein